MLETIETRPRARVRCRVWRRRASLVTARASRAAPARRAAVGDRVLLGVGELGHRAAGVAVGDEDRVVAEAARRRAALGAIVPAQRPSKSVSAPSGVDEAITHT